jgi:gamma-glutamyltranspeptidase/glutathione hydrolase
MPMLEPPGHSEPSAAAPGRPELSARDHMVVAGHYGAAHAAFRVLEAGGNAVDAGVAGGIALGVLQSDIVNVAGVAPILVYLARSDEVVSISGLGTWPRKASAEYFRRNHGGLIPPGLLRTVVPAAPAAWIAALERYGTMTFGDVAAAAIRFARDGFVMHPLMAEVIRDHEADYRQWPSSAAIYLPNGRPPAVGEVFVQADLARTLQFMADEEKKAARHGRQAGLRAARDAFYKGDIAATILRYHAENGGWLAAEDMAGFDVEIEAAVRIRYKDYEVCVCPPWCQGPALGQALKLVEGMDLKALGHNTVDYIHHLTEALKLVFADRERYYGDPRFVDVPLARLLSDDYARMRRRLIDPERACRGMAPAGDGEILHPTDAGRPARPQLDTSYICVIDRHGNAFSATPSDTSSESPVIPGTGLVPSMRGSQSWTEQGHASELAPGKRPRLTPTPALALGRHGRLGREVFPFGTPGGDVQIQAMLQAFVNVVEFGMDLQRAVETPRFSTYSFPDSFQPHTAQWDRLNLEAPLFAVAAERLRSLGHDAQRWPDKVWRAGAMCMIRRDPDTGLLLAGADPRRPCYALGW